MFIKDCKETDFNPVCELKDPDKADTLLLKILNDLVDTNLPEKIVRLRQTDNRFFTSELKQVDGQMKREFGKRGKSKKITLKEHFNSMYQKAAKAHLRDNVDRLLKTKPGQAHNVLKKLGARPGEDVDGNDIQLSELMDRDLTAEQKANEIGNYFASISQEFQPVNIDRLPKEVKETILNAKPEEFL